MWLVFKYCNIVIITEVVMTEESTSEAESRTEDDKLQVIDVLT